MDSKIFDGGGSFEGLFWTGEDSSQEAPRNTTDQRMEIAEEIEVKRKKRKKKSKKNKEEEIEISREEE